MHINLRGTLGILLLWATSPGGAPAQETRSEQEEVIYGTRFFDQLRSLFGQFRDSDLRRAFEQAKPIQCSELVGRTGEWRPVAFFNEDRSLGGWHRENLDEVKADPSVYTFQGTCKEDRGTIQVGTEFPTNAGIEAYKSGKIGLDQIEVTVNDPVDAVFNAATQAYTFELPYLFLTGQQASRRIYSLIAPDRHSSYNTDVASRWECKAVFSENVTYRFLICRVATVPSRKRARGRFESVFGASAYFILSDGTEAQTSVNLSFGDEPPEAAKPEEAAPPAPGYPPRPALKRPKKPR